MPDNPELPPEDRAIRLKITGDPDNSGSTREAVFEWSTGDDQAPFSISQVKRTETRAFGGTPLTLLGDLLGIDTPTENADIALDFGSSTFALEVGGVITADQRLPDGSQCQWGDTGDDSALSATDATGAHPAHKASILAYWLRGTRNSSIGDPLGDGEGGGPAILETLQYRENGVHEPLTVIPESPSISYSSGSVTVAEIDMTVVEIASLDQAIDAVENDGR